MAYLPLKPDEVYHIVIHCSSTSADRDVNAADIRHWHRTQGWDDIGYHFVIKRDGEVEEGRSLDIPGAHAYGYNNNSVGVCLVGGAKKDQRTVENNFTDEQFEAARVLAETLLVKYPNARVVGHRDLPGVQKGCPSFDVEEWYYK